MFCSFLTISMRLCIWDGPASGSLFYLQKTVKMANFTNEMIGQKMAIFVKNEGLKKKSWAKTEQLQFIYYITHATETDLNLNSLHVTNLLQWLYLPSIFQS